jgi:hypothetical protein
MTKFTLLFSMLSMFAIPVTKLTGITLLGAALMAVSVSADQKTPFTGKSVTRSSTIHLNGPIAKVFPLFEPIGEKSWVPGWEPEVVYPENGVAQSGTVFLTYDDQGKNATYWTIIEYETQPHRITYINVIPNYQVRRITVECREVAPNKTDATVSYTYTGTSQHGNEDVSKQTEERYAANMQHWTHAINHYLETGKTIEMH